MRIQTKTQFRGMFQNNPPSRKPVRTFGDPDARATSSSQHPETVTGLALAGAASEHRGHPGVRGVGKEDAFHGASAWQRLSISTAFSERRIFRWSPRTPHLRARRSRKPAPPRTPIRPIRTRHLGPAYEKGRKARKNGTEGRRTLFEFPHTDGSDYYHGK
ncbi:hypothetical protein CPLU01_06069 [Colletotrichum plurivorum]|uniref:Uncharacterized protein n=1 Tax=Colletotrichum plurivorum TaxID=2175906 RepID=A0A8H6KKK4_9PEZI|nr:hypothetical protein CPLU01_06069 [Colletotrichum plurivorum]